MQEFIVGLALGITAYYAGGWRLYVAAAVLVLAVYSCRDSKALEPEKDPNLHTFKTEKLVKPKLTTVNELYPWKVAHPSEQLPTLKLKEYVNGNN